MDMLHVYLQSKRPKTRAQYKRYVEAFLNKPVDQLTVEDVFNYFTQLESEGKALGTQQFARSIIKNFLYFADRPDLASKISSIRYAPDSFKPLSESEYKKLIDSIDESIIWGLQFSLMCRMLWETGMRVGEMTRLKIEDIDMRNPVAILRTEKSYKERKIVWSNETHMLMLKFLEVRMYISASPYLFIAREKGGRGDQVSTRTVQRWMSLISRELGFVIHPHRFRHSWAVERRKKRASLAFIQEGLGHSSPASTFRYTKYGPEFEEEAKGYL